MKRTYVLILLAISLTLTGAASSATSGSLYDQLYEAASAQPKAWYAPEHADALGARETPEDYDDRMRVIAQAIDKATADDDGKVHPSRWVWGRRSLAMVVLTHMYLESRFALEVHMGVEHPVWTQDNGKARCLGQLHVHGAVPKHEWDILGGIDLDATKRCAEWTAEMLTRMARMCVGKRNITQHEQLSLLFSGMRGKGCYPTKAGEAKAHYFRRIGRAMERARRP